MTLVCTPFAGRHLGAITVSLAVCLALGVGAIQAQDASPRSEAEQRVLQYMIDQKHTRHVDTLSKLGVTPGDGFFDCVCRRAGYGSSSTSQFYHPGTIGEYNPLYSCNQPGPPCVVSGFGCSRHPLPAGQEAWEACAQKMYNETGENPLDAALSAIAKREAEKPVDHTARLEQCRGDYWAHKDGADASARQDGMAYLGDSGVPLLRPPKSLAGELKVQADREAAKMAAKLRKQQAELKKVTENGLTAEVAKPMAGVVNRDRVKEAAKIALELLKLDILDAQTKAGGAKDDNKKALSRWRDEPERELRKAELSAKASTSAAAQQRLLDLQSQKADLQTFINGLDQMGDAEKLGDLYKKFSSGDRRQQAQGFVDTTSLVKKYVDKYKGGSAALLKDLKVKAAGAGLSDAEAAALEARLASTEAWTGASDVLGETIKAGAWAMKTYDAVKEFERELARSQEMATSGRYSANQRRLLDSFRAMSIAAKKGAGYLPPGMSEIVAFYGTVLETPAQFDKVMREIVDKPDDFANIKGSQAHSQAMYKFNNDHGDANLMRDPYMYREAKLSAYRIDNPRAGQPPFVLIPDEDGEPIYLDRKNFEKVREMAYLFPIVHGRRMTDADVAEALGNMGAKGTVNIDDLRNKANTALGDAAKDKHLARMFGAKTLKGVDTGEWWDFNDLMTDSLPKTCALPLQTQKRLFGAWRDAARREQVIAYLQDYGAKLKAADHAKVAQDSKAAEATAQ